MIYVSIMKWVKRIIVLFQVSSTHYNIFDTGMSNIIENVAAQIPDTENQQIMKVLLKHLNQDYIKKNVSTYLFIITAFH